MPRSRTRRKYRRSPSKKSPSKKSPSKKGPSKKELFQRYSRNSDGILTPMEFETLMHTEYRMFLSHHTMTACYATWFEGRDGSRVLPFTSFLTMYKHPHGFLRDFNGSILRDV